MTERIMVNGPARNTTREAARASAGTSGTAKEKITYAQAGVDIDEGARAVDAIKDAVHRTYRPEVVGDIGGFGGLFSLAAAKDMEDPLLVSGTDGVGTKLKVAQIANRHSTVGIDLVAMCANDILACGAEPLFFLDYIAVGKLKAEAVGEIVGGIADGCEQAGCALIGGEMAEHPGVMAADDYDLSGFCVGLVDRPKMIGPDLVREGDVLIGLASTGLHSNGYSLARKVAVEGKTHYELRFIREELGGRCLEDALLEPTRIYVKPVLGLLRELPGAVHALAHITGGGITENLNRALPKTLDAKVNLGAWPVPPIVKWVCDAAGLEEADALTTFNMGLGMILLVDAARVDEVMATLDEMGEKYWQVGSVVPGEGKVAYEKNGCLYGYVGEAASSEETPREEPPRNTNRDIVPLLPEELRFAEGEGAAF